MDIKKQIENVLDKYKTLSFDQVENKLYGEVFASENDSYSVEIDISSFPQRFPVVEEVGERIPKKADRHIYPHNGACCFTTSAKSQILLKTKIKTLDAFIRLILIPYLQNNSYFEINKKYFSEEFSHGMKGVLEGYKDILGLNNDYKTLKVLYDRLTNDDSKYSGKCYCGSGVGMKTCSKGKHFKNYNNFKMIDRLTLSSNLTDMIDYLKK